MIKSYKQFIFFILGAVIVTIELIGFYQSTYFTELKDWSQQNELLYIVTLSIIKIVGIVWPPLPGGILTLGSIPLIGWVKAYMADFIGGLIGSVIAFFLSRKYGKKLLIRIFDDNTIEKITTVKIKKNRQFEMMFIMLLLGNNVVEGIAYGTGLIKQIRFRYFLLARIISHLLLGIPTYYFAEKIIKGESIVVSIIFLLILFPLLWKLRHRYIEL